MTTTAVLESLRVLRDDGTLDPAVDPGLDAPALVSLHRTMRLSQELGERLAAAAKSGLVEHVAEGGAEGALVGAASALAEGDWLFPDPRHVAAALRQGVSLDEVLAHVFAVEGDATKGRASRAGLALRRAAVGSYGFHNGAHLTHAAGVAWGARIRHDKIVALATFEANEVSAGEFHNALNFAGVFRLPVVFLGVRRAGVSGHDGVANRGLAYGVPAVVCDGNDVLAIVRACTDAVARARRGEGATIVEASHVGDPGVAVTRFERHLTKCGLDASMRGSREAIAHELDRAFACVEGAAQPSAESMFDDVYASPPGTLIEAREAFARLASRPSATESDKS